VEEVRRLGVRARPLDPDAAASALLLASAHGRPWRPPGNATRTAAYWARRHRGTPLPSGLAAAGSRRRLLGSPPPVAGDRPPLALHTQGGVKRKDE